MKKCALIFLVSAIGLFNYGCAKPKPKPTASFSISMVTEGTSITPSDLPKDKAYQGTINVTIEDKIIDHLTSVTLKDSNSDITEFCEYNPSEDYKSADLTIPLDYLTNNIEVAVTLMDKPDPSGPFTVTWDLDDGSIPIKETYEKGETPSYKHDIYYKEGHSEDYGYLFESWDKPLEPVTGDITFKALYETKESCVATSFILMTLKEANVDHCEFRYTGQLKEVDWGDGSPRDQLNTHTYPTKDSETYPVKIFGNITSISFADETAVYGKSNLAMRCITLASTITDLPDNAFKDCTYMNSVYITKNVKHVGDNALDNLHSSPTDPCLIYTQTGISTTGWGNWNPDGYRVVENINRMGLAEDVGNPGNYFGYLVQQQGQEEYLAISSYYDKRGYNELTSITIPDKIDGMYVNSIIYSPFAFYTQLTTFNIEATQLYYVGEEGLKLGKMSTLSLPKTLTIIGYRAFYQNVNLTTINLNDNESLTSIGDEAFNLSTKIESSIKLPSSVTYIGHDAFNFCHGIKITNLENTQITDIYSGTFCQCWEITSIGLPITLKNIHAGAFENCKNMATIDASKYESDTDVPTAEADAFKTAKSDAIVICSKAFTDETSAKTAFTSKGWPSTFTYQLES